MARPLSCYSSYPGSVLYFTGIPGLTSPFVSQFTRASSKNFYLPYVFIETSLCTSFPGSASSDYACHFFLRGGASFAFQARSSAVTHQDTWRLASERRSPLSYGSTHDHFQTSIS